MKITLLSSNSARRFAGCVSLERDKRTLSRNFSRNLAGFSDHSGRKRGILPIASTTSTMMLMMTITTTPALEAEARETDKALRKILKQLGV